MQIAIPEEEDCSGSGTPYTFEDYKVSLSSTVSLHTISPLSRTNTVSTNACGEITSITSGSWSSNGSPMQIAIPEGAEAEDCNGSPQTATLTDNRVSISTSSVSLGTLLTWTPLKRESVVTFDSCGKYVSLSSGNWAASSEFFASSVTIPDSSSTSTEECSEDAADTSTSTETEYRINMTSNSAGQVTHQRQKRTIVTTYNSCGHFMNQASPSAWTNDTGTGSQVTFNTLPSGYSTQTVAVCENGTSKTLTVMGTKT
jgi:hypothetical protein